MTLSEIDPEETLTRLVLRHPEVAPVLQRHHLEFCCNGELPLDQACQDQRVPVDQVVAELKAVVAARGTAGQSAAVPSTGALVQDLQRLHDYLRRVMTFLQPLAEEVEAHDAGRNPRLKELTWNVRDLAAALLPHLDAEFRLILTAAGEGGPSSLPSQRALDTLEAEHQELGDLLADVRLTAEDFKAPGWASLDYRTLLLELEAFEGHLMRAVHLENHLLFPRLG
jgi:regulator of cell morphogenesis and NO signaling